MIDRNIRLDFNDILIKPAVQSDIISRYKEIDTKTDAHVKNNMNSKHRMLPLMTAPMSSVVDETCIEQFLKQGIVVVLPRTVKYGHPLSYISPNVYYSYSISDFNKLNFAGEVIKDYPTNILIDIANGHMKQILDSVKRAKTFNPNLNIMVGNVANPETYKIYAESGVVDSVRIGIGNGNGCLTTQQTGVGFPMASLIEECYYIKREIINEHIHYNRKDKINTVSAIIADGGMKDYSDIIKALGLGADFVMAGSIFNKALESAGETYLNEEKLPKKVAYDLYSEGVELKKQYYGMSTKLAQKKMGAEKTKTSEGVVRYRPVEYTLAGWVENFDSYLRSAMSYSDSRTLDEFRKKTEFIQISNNGLNRFKK
jgi:GMP reductase